MDAVASGVATTLDEDAYSGRRNRVVLTPRPWRQAGRAYPAGDGGKNGRSPGRARISRKTTRAGKAGMSRLYLWFNPCAFLTELWHTGLRAQSALCFSKGTFRHAHIRRGRRRLLARRALVRPYVRCPDPQAPARCRAPAGRAG